MVEDSVDYIGLGDEGDDPHLLTAAGTGQRLSNSAQRRFASRIASDSGSTISSGCSTPSPLAWRRVPLKRSLVSLPAGGAGRLVGVVGDGAVLLVVLHAAECDRITGAVTSEAYGELGVVGCHPDPIVCVESECGQASML